MRRAMRKFQATGAVMERAWAWALIPAALFLAGVWMLASGSYLGVIVVNFAALAFTIGLLKKPRNRRPAAITIEDGFVRANHHERLAPLSSVAGVSIVGTGSD